MQPKLNTTTEKSPKSAVDWSLLNRILKLTNIVDGLSSMADKLTKKLVGQNLASNGDNTKDEDDGEDESDAESRPEVDNVDQGTTEGFGAQKQIGGAGKLKAFDSISIALMLYVYVTTQLMF